MNERVIQTDGKTGAADESAATPVHDRPADRKAGGRAEIGQAFVERRASTADRRRTTLRSFLQGALTPRRRSGRRAEDHQIPIDWHDPHLLFLAIAALLLSVADAFLTVTLLANGAIETNPLLARILNTHPDLFAAIKLLLTGLGVIVLVAVARRRLLGIVTARTLFEGLVLAYVGLVLYELWLFRQLL